MITGNRPADGGALIIEARDYDEFIRKESLAKKFIKRLIGSEEFINRKLRYCLCLVNATPTEIRKMHLVYARVEKCRENRLKGANNRQKLAETPHLFRETKNPARCIVIPKVSGERRKYIPMEIADDKIILTDLLFIIPDGNLYHFGVLKSIIHMAWVRVTCGRLGSSYRYSATVVYNNFVWCESTFAQKKAIEGTAKEILAVRARYSDATLADLYDEVTMPRDLRLAHKKNDMAVAKAYGFEEILSDEQKIVGKLFEMYESLTKN